MSSMALGLATPQWGVGFTSEHGEAIVDFDKSSLQVPEQFQTEVDAAIVAADALAPNSEDAIQSVQMSGFTTLNGEAFQRVIQVSVTQQPA